MIELDCTYDDSPHLFEDDWIFGGSDNCDPRADERWLPTTYTYLDRLLQDCHVTQTPLCDAQAIDEFTKVSNWGDLAPVYLQVKRPGEVKPTVLDIIYVRETDTVHPLG